MFYPFLALSLSLYLSLPPPLLIILVTSPNNTNARSLPLSLPLPSRMLATGASRSVGARQAQLGGLQALRGPRPCSYA